MRFGNISKASRGVGVCGCVLGWCVCVWGVFCFVFETYVCLSFVDPLTLRGV